MKYSKYIMILISLFLFSCAQDELIDTPDETQKVYTVSLKLNGDIQAEESPLSRVETTSVYGIQVYKDDSYFASGVFSDANNISINLQAGGAYRFVCTAIKDAEKIHISGSELPFRYKEKEREYRWQYKDYRYFYNYLLWGGFRYSSSSTFALTNLSSSEVTIEEGYDDASICSEIDRFYGELDNYTPSVNGVVNLQLKRVSFGFKLQVTNIKEGKVSVTCKNDYNTFATASNIENDYETEATVYSMANIYDAWKYASTGYTEPLTLTVTWDREGGLISDTWTKTVLVKRNAMNTIRIKMSTDEMGDVGIGPNPEGGDMENEETEIPLG